MLDEIVKQMGNLLFAYIGIVSIVVMFLPKNNIISRAFKEFASICTSIFKK